MLRLAISLPLRNQAALGNLVQNLYDPASADYHHYLTPAQFTEKFGPTKQDYDAVVQFATRNGFKIAARHDSRMLLDVNATVADVERTFQVTMRHYQHPTESRHFYAPDAAPSIDENLPIQDVAGLENFSEAHSMLRAKPVRVGDAAKPVSASGSGADGYYLGYDFRRAYAPGVNLTGAGQTVGVLEMDGYLASDISSYETLAGLPNVTLTNIDVTNFSGPPGDGVFEVTLDIDMAIAMAPGLSEVAVFQAGGNTSIAGFEDIFESMAASNTIKQFSSSWGFTGVTDPDTNIDFYLLKMASQGQSFFQASGDGDAWINPIWVPADSTNLVSVGGTELVMTGTGASYASESVWNAGSKGSGNGWPANETVPGNHHAQNDYVGSAGGVSTVYGIPPWQTNAINSTNKGSSTFRNIPDVALTGDKIIVVVSNVQYELSGTSCAAPLWAGFTALVNQQAAAGGSPTVGWLNPAFYALGRSTNYTNVFHDTTSGNNTNQYSTNLFSAVPGYDLCTGWGTPNGAAMINALSPEPLVVTPISGFAATGPYGGPFSVTNQTFVLTNAAPSPLVWVVVNTNSWLAVSSLGGTLLSGGPATNVSVSLGAGADSLAAGTYSGTVLFSNVNDTTTQGRPFSLTISQATPVLSWSSPAGLTYGTALTSAQLDATAGVPGNFVYNPAAGAILTAGSHTLSVTFTPTDTTDYHSAVTNVVLVVSPAPLSVTAANASRPYGTANPVFTGTITGLQNSDNITAVYNCTAATNSPVGAYPIVPSLVDPNNRLTNYTVALTNGALTITKAGVTLNWPPPAAINYPAALGSNQLDATATAPGAFAFTPAAGAVPPPGTNTLSVLFTPTDTVDYSNASATAQLLVSLAPIPLNITRLGSNVVLTWNDPDSVFTLQGATAVTNAFTNIPGAASPLTNAIKPGQQYFRLIAPAP